MNNQLSLNRSAPAKLTPYQMKIGSIFRFQNGGVDHFYIRIPNGIVSLKNGEHYTFGDRPGDTDMVRSGETLSITVE